MSDEKRFIDDDYGDDVDDEELEQTPEDVIKILGFDPAKESVETQDSKQEAKQKFFEGLSTMRKAKLDPMPEPPKIDEPVQRESVRPNNTSGITYKEYQIKQDMLDGTFHIFSVGGVLIGRTESLEMAMNRINEISINNGGSDVRSDPSAEQ